MSKKKLKPILSDKIAELTAPRRLLDPEIDSEDETAARAVDYDIEDELGETEAVSRLSDIRRRNVKLLHDVNPKYRGKVSSRKEMEMELEQDSNESEENDSDENGDDNDLEIEENNTELESNDKSIGEFSMILTPRQKIKLAQEADDGDEQPDANGNETSSEDEDDIKSFAMKLNSSKSKGAIISESEDDLGGNDNDLEKWDDDYEGEEVEEEQSSDDGNGIEDESGGDEEFDSEEDESDFDGGDMMPQTVQEKPEKQDLSRILPKQQSDNQLNKGVCVQNQLQIWEKLLEVRIHSQKMLIKANSLPQPAKFEQLSAENVEFSELANDTVNKVSTLVSQMRDLQSLLMKQYSETKEIALKRKPINTDRMNDSEAKRKRLADHLETDYSNFKDYQYSVISKWHDRTKVLTPGSIKTQKQQGNIDVLRKIEGVLANREELIKKSQLLKGGYDLFDKNTGTIEYHKRDVSMDNEEKGEAEQMNDESIYSTEIYDDTDFYHTQLRELIEYKTSSSSNANEMAKQFSELQKLRKKMKKTVDTRASKGRKIRYVVHNKLVSFMAPNDPANSTDEQRDELFKSLFGAQL